MIQAARPRCAWSGRTAQNGTSGRKKAKAVTCCAPTSPTWTPEELWKTYVQLTEAESASRIHKTELSLRPIWHQRADRVQAHILVCFLASVLWKTLEQWQKRAGIGNSPRMLLDEISSIQSADVILPLATSPARELRLRCVVRPDRSQAMLLDRLGLRLPERLRPRFPGA